MDELLSEIEKFIALHEMGERRFGTLALNDPHFVKDIRDSRSPSLRTVERVRSFMAGFGAKQAA